MNFEELKINESLCEALKKQEITEPTEIQQELIPLMLEGKDEEKIRILAEEIAEVIKERLI